MRHIIVTATSTLLSFFQQGSALSRGANLRSSPVQACIRTAKRLAQTLQLPSDAAQIQISRSGQVITISSDYDQVIKLPFKKERVLHFHPYVASRL